jgi:LysM repeat protein
MLGKTDRGQLTGCYERMLKRMRKILIVLLTLSLLMPTAGSAFADTIYIVQRGDTLFGIATRFGVSLSALAAANAISNLNLIFVGEPLTIPGTDGGGGTNPPPPPPTGGGTTYIIQRGDTLGLIAQRFGVSLADLINANSIANPNLVFVGQVLVIPSASGGTGNPPPPGPTATSPAPPPASGGTTYTVQGGDTLWAIALQFGVSVADIQSANGLNSTLIFVGQVLNIPGAGGGGNPPPGPTATSPAPTPPPPPPSNGSWALGGQVSDFSGASKMTYAGMSWVKRQLRWVPGAAADAGLINDAHAKGFKILLSVLGNPGDISGGANFDNYAAYVGQLAGLGADAIEIWNEMNLDREWPAGQINPATYTDLLQRSYTQIKAKNANTLVILGALSPTGAEGAFGLAHVWNDSRYLDGLAAAGAANYADCIGVHYNEGIVSPTQASGDPRDDYYTRYFGSMVATYYNAFGGSRQLCFTELGYLTPEGYGPLPGAFGWAGNTTLAQQAQWLGQAASLSRDSGKVRLMIVFNVDFTIYNDDPQAGYAIIRPGGVCPACDSLRAVTGGR